MRKSLWGWGLTLLVFAVPLSAQQAQGPPPVDLGENFPNPFWPSTTIPFTLNQELCRGGRRPVVAMRVMNVLAQPVAVPVLRGSNNLRLDGVRLSCGRYLADWDGQFEQVGQEISPGVYLVVLTVDGQRYVGRMIARRSPPVVP